jgi:hypothetical protein
MLPTFDLRSHFLVTKERREPDNPAQGQLGIIGDQVAYRQSA